MTVPRATSPVQAYSLAAVQDLASNPQAHPYAEGFDVSGCTPLILYIARVPGSRDVFLTPLKPREKVVTAQDVRSSLYYVHVTEDNGGSHGRTRHARHDSGAVVHDRTKSSSSDSPYLRATPQQRDPPLTPPYAGVDRLADFSRAAPLAQDRRRIESSLFPSLPSDSLQVMRKPVPPKHASVAPAWEHERQLPVIPRRPLHSPPEETFLAESLHDHNVQMLKYAEHLDDLSNPYARDYPTLSEAATESDDFDPISPGSLTLIRRDPGSGAQWNVASIHDQPNKEAGSSTSLPPPIQQRSKRCEADLYLDITNPGYARFNDTPDRPTSRDSASVASLSSSDQPQSGVFRRRLHIPGSRHSAIPTHRKHFSTSSTNNSSNSSHIPLPDPKALTNRHSLNLSSLSTRPNPSFQDSKIRGGAAGGGKDYTFTTPWHTHCTFTTSLTGHNIKCRHHLPDPANGKIDKTEVSELRFNLANTTFSFSNPPPLAQRRSSYFPSPHPPRLLPDGADDDEEEEEEWLDLSLGREAAGGGLSGKHAKLGKLIVFPHGWAMLDLLVAANVGLWWRAYERVLIG